MSNSPCYARDYHLRLQRRQVYQPKPKSLHIPAILNHFLLLFIQLSRELAVFLKTDPERPPPRALSFAPLILLFVPPIAVDKHSPLLQNV
jgi:hypothetical protein